MFFVGTLFESTKSSLPRSIALVSCSTDVLVQYLQSNFWGCILHSVHATYPPAPPGRPWKPTIVLPSLKFSCAFFHVNFSIAVCRELPSAVHRGGAGKGLQGIHVPPHHPAGAREHTVREGGRGGGVGVLGPCALFSFNGCLPQCSLCFVLPLWRLSAATLKAAVLNAEKSCWLLVVVGLVVVLSR